VTVAFTGDEEDPGSPLSITRRDLVAAARSSDVALEFESLVADEEHDYATIARRGASDWTLTASGRIGHSSGVFGQESGYGAVYEAARILDAFRRELAGEPHLTFNPGLVLGGTEIRHDAARQRGSASGKTNVIAPTVVVAGDVRTISSEQADRARERMREIVSAHLPGTSAEIVFGEGYPPMAPTAGNEALLELLNEINRDLGAPALLALDPDRRGAADSSFAAPYTDCLAGLGMRGEGGHTPDESVDLRTLPLQVKRAALLVYRLTR
jgi:glutamate carboxypeptidase